MLAHCSLEDLRGGKLAEADLASPPHPEFRECGVTTSGFLNIAHAKHSGYCCERFNAAAASAIYRVAVAGGMLRRKRRRSRGDDAEGDATLWEGCPEKRSKGTLARSWVTSAGTMW
jgi:hypothetical protein